MNVTPEGLTHGSIWPDDDNSDSGEEEQINEPPSYVPPDSPIPPKEKGYVPPASPVPPKKKGCLKTFFGVSLITAFANKNQPLRPETQRVVKASDESLTSLPKEIRELVRRRRQKHI